MNDAIQPDAIQKIVHVAVGVIYSPTHQVLICWRDASLHQGNRHEFPGGKVEAGETPQQALARELAEELNIEIRSVIRAQQLRYSYPEKTVCLHVFKVTHFVGEAVGQQQQAVHWIHRDELSRYTFPDANAPILKMVHLPDYYVIAQPAANLSLAEQHWQAWLQWHIVHTPVSAWLYVRHHGVDGQTYNKIIEALHQARPDLRLLVMAQFMNDVKFSWASLQGIHFSQNELMRLTPADLSQLPSHWHRLAACHDEQSIVLVNQLNIDAIVLSPVMATATHPEAQALGWTAWQQLALKSHVPVYALGGMSPKDLQTAQQHGGFGVAGIRSFYQ